MLHMQTCLDRSVPFSEQSMDCAVWCLMGRKSNQPNVTNTIVVRLEMCRQQLL